MTNVASIMVVEDDRHLREAVADTIELAGYRCIQADSGEAALNMMKSAHIDMVVSDVNMGGMDGHALLKKIKQVAPQLPVMLMTAYATIDASIDAIRNGAVDYLVKPFAPKELVSIIAKYVDFKVGDDEEPVAQDPSSIQLFQLAERVAVTDSTVLISGESGTGKEVLARYIHRHSPRAKQPFVAINCAAIPENMLEATLFGHEKGAYTGAYSSAPGKFEQANGGTLLLDEISEMDLGLQAKLLRVIQEREVERLGGRKTIPLDVRIIATTNRHMVEEVQAKTFREDLYYRLSVFPLHWSALRDRPLDIVPLAKRLLQQHAAKMRHIAVSLDASAQQALIQHAWPGNVRELDNVMQRALIMQPHAVISAEHLRLDPFAISANAIAPVAAAKIDIDMPNLAQSEAQLNHLVASGHAQVDVDGGLSDDLKQREYQLILQALINEKGSRKSVSDKLGISPRTLRYKLAQMRDSGIDIDAALSAA